MAPTEHRTVEEEQSPKDDHASKPGEIYFVVFLLVVVAAFMVEAFKLPGLQNGLVSASGVIPQIVTTAVFFMLIIVAISLLHREKRPEIKAVMRFLFSAEVVVLLTLITLYAFLLEILRFQATSLLFLWITMYFLERKQPVKKLIIAAGTVAVIVLIFGYAFRVILP
ncbi:MAG: tripartite tricarboxylate transporter TctB family protein [bacterium]|nr:tripartite tricarboxylate transporter TctB family protein [bacterium]